MVEVVVTCGNRKAISGGMGTDDPNIIDQTRARKIKRAIEGGMQLARPFVSS